MGGSKKAANRATLFYIYALGYGLFGMYHFGVVVMLYILAFTVLTYSFVELVSIVPFSGGCYGYSRCALGPFMGYVAGMFETAKYILYATFNIYRLGHIFVVSYELDENHQILIWLAFVVIFIFGATSEGSVSNIEGSRWNSKPSEFVDAFPYAVYTLSALDAVRTCMDEQGGNMVPKALLQVLAWAVIAIFSMIVAESAYNYDDSALLKEDYAYSTGLRKVFSMSADNQLVTLFALPSSLGCCVGFLYCAARQVRSMASSGLLPPILAMGQGQKVKDSSQPVAAATAVVPGGTSEEAAKNMSMKDDDDIGRSSKPTMAVFACSVFCFGLLLVGYYTIDKYNDMYTQMGQLLNALMYQPLMVSYMVFATRFSSMERGIRSPFGIPGAIFAMAFFMMLFSLRMYTNTDTNVAFGVTLVIFTACVVVYYILVVQKRQFFSKEEQEKFMKAYVVNANKTRKKAKSASNTKQSNRSSKFLAIFYGAFGGMRNNPSQAPSSRSRASSKKDLGPA
eukprot:scaffold850_cov189-Ochromonas_danica.AAC.4